jgi:hypothetical protein
MHLSEEDETTLLMYDEEGNERDFYTNEVRRPVQQGSGNGTWDGNIGFIAVMAVIGGGLLSALGSTLGTAVLWIGIATLVVITGIKIGVSFKEPSDPEPPKQLIFTEATTRNVSSAKDWSASFVVFNPCGATTGNVPSAEDWRNDEWKHEGIDWAREADWSDENEL